jgi:AraC-like DNA-binding protein
MACADRAHVRRVGSPGHDRLALPRRAAGRVPEQRGAGHLGRRRNLGCPASARGVDPGGDRTPVTTTALACGWSNPSAFIETFRRCFGATPRKFYNDTRPTPRASAESVFSGAGAAARSSRHPAFCCYQAGVGRRDRAGKDLGRKTRWARANPPPGNKFPRSFAKGCYARDLKLRLNCFALEAAAPANRRPQLWRRRQALARTSASARLILNDGYSITVSFHPPLSAGFSI